MGSMLVTGALKRRGLLVLSAVAVAGVATAVPAGATPVRLTLASSTSASRAVSSSSATDAPPSQIVLDNGGYKSCLNDYHRDTKAGAPVDLYTCSSADPASKWVPYPDLTLRPYDDQSLELTVGANHKLVLEPSISGGNADQTWFTRPDGTLVSGTSVGGSTNNVLNDPGYATRNGTQLIIWNQPVVTTNAHFWITGAHYASSRLADRPDSAPVNWNPPGPAWADDNITRSSMVLWLGDSAPGSTSYPHSYEVSLYDSGSFRTIPGADVPNPYQNSDTPTEQQLGAALSGTVTGSHWAYVSTDHYVSRAPAKTYSGNGPIDIPDWWKLWFPTDLQNIGVDSWNSSYTFAWSWTYTSARDACGHTETWTEGIFNNYGESPGAGDITAPATCSS